MNDTLHVLIVDDSEDDAMLLVRKLNHAGYQVLSERIDTPQAMNDALEQQTWDVILCDYNMPRFSAPDALRLMQEKDLDIPFIIVSGTIGEETAVSAMKAGAHDYLMKDKLAKLTVSIEKEIHDAKIRRDKRNAEYMLKRSEENFHHSIDDSPLGVMIVDENAGIIYANREFLNLFGCGTIEELKATPPGKRYTPESFAEYEIRNKMLKDDSFFPARYETDIVRKDGSIRNAEVFLKKVLWNGQIRIQALYADITKSKQAEQDLKNSEERYRLVVENSHESILITQNKKVVFANQAVITNLGYSLEALKSGEFIQFIHPDDRLMILDYNRKRLSGENVPSDYTFRVLHRDGRILWVEMNVTLVEWENKPATLVFLKDVTESKLLEEERAEHYNRMRTTLDATIHSIANIVEARDPYTTGHQRRVAQIARAIASVMGLSNEQNEFIGMAATIHDIGKLSIPAEILTKPTRLTDLEYELIKTHAQAGFNIVKDIEFPWPVATVILQHHERMNGTGYPGHLNGDEILLESKIVSVADVVEAISSDRPYRPKLGIEVALEEIARNRGILFDKQIVDACLTLFRDKCFVLS